MMIKTIITPIAGACAVLASLFSIGNGNQGQGFNEEELAASVKSRKKLSKPQKIELLRKDTPPTQSFSGVTSVLELSPRTPYVMAKGDLAFLNCEVVSGMSNAAQLNGGSQLRLSFNVSRPNTPHLVILYVVNNLHQDCKVRFIANPSKGGGDRIDQMSVVPYGGGTVSCVVIPNRAGPYPLYAFTLGRLVFLSAEVNVADGTK
jgi:hypothetical protein